ncbi:MAG: Asp-tRNA(Asn)/Glu-tRNA(Gln) amidotransferase subunit GatC [Patescibacteria group bacterium]
MRAANISSDSVGKVAKLAKLSLTVAQKQKFAQQLSSVIGYVSKVQKLDTSNVPETSQVTGLENVFREDEVDVSRILTQEQALSNAKRTHNGFFVVKALFE